MNVNVRHNSMALSDCGMIHTGVPCTSQRLGRLTPQPVARRHTSRGLSGIRHTMFRAIRKLSIPRIQFTKLPVHAWVGGVALSASTMLMANFESRPISVCRDQAAMSMSLSPMVSTQSFAASGVTHENGGSQGTALNSQMANLLQIQLLEMGLAKLDKASEYRAVFMKQECISGSLTDMQEIQIKVKQEPFSVYMQWTKCMEGREVLYVDGQNENKMLVHLEGVQGRITGTLKLDPEGMLAMRESRHPIMEVGLKNLVLQVLDYRKKEAEKSLGSNCYCLDNQVEYGRKCILFVTEYTTPEVSKDYRKSMVYIDRETYLPVTVRNFGWGSSSDSELTAAELDKQTLLESYSYINPTFEAPMVAADFDPDNSVYNFK